MMKKLLAGALVLALFAACTKGPGEGGRAFIKGKLYVKNYKAYPDTTLQASYWAQDENVFIIYGDEPGVGKSVKSAYDGSFQFEYLRKGKYKVYALSDDRASGINSKTKEVLVEVEIKSATETVDIGTITIEK
jgi:hypothetical protein